MENLLYSELAPWYRMLDPVEDHAEEAIVFRDALVGATDGEARSCLEIGAGAGHNAFYLKSDFDCTLCDLSTDMLSLSRELNPTCEHVEGDMRSLRLGRVFDTILIHDAICYMTTEADLRAAIETAFVHTRPGGAALIAPDLLTERFAESSNIHQAADGTRALRCMEWMWDPDPSDSTYVTDYAFLLREGTSLRAVHDRHVEGLFDRATWIRLLEEVGFEVRLVTRPIGEGETDEVFLGRRAP